MPTLKFYKYFLYFLLIVVVAGTIFLFNRNRTLNNLDTQQEVFRQNKFKYRLQIKGFKFDSFDDGENVLSIKADTFTVEKKKLGFFRFGLINVAIFKNATIDVYLKRKVSGNDADLIREALPSLKDALPSFSTKRIFSIIIEPVCLNLQDENSLLTQITSNSAIIRLTKQNILFKGGVQVVSGDKSLITERLNLFTENSVMKADRHFILKTSEKKIEGNHITVDMFLNVVKDEIIRKPEDSNRSAS
jgi:hypothetical protein